MKSFSNIADRVQIIIPSAILYVFALMMLSLCDQYWQIMLVQGVLMGIVMGLLQFPAFAAVSQYFDKKRAAALGVVVSGSSIGGVVCVSGYSGLQEYG
jgi:MFS family permease